MSYAVDVHILLTCDYSDLNFLVPGTALDSPFETRDTATEWLRELKKIGVHGSGNSAHITKATVTEWPEEDDDDDHDIFLRGRKRLRGSRRKHSRPRRWSGTRARLVSHAHRYSAPVGKNISRHKNTKEKKVVREYTVVIDVTHNGNTKTYYVVGYKNDRSFTTRSGANLWHSNFLHHAKKLAGITVNAFVTDNDVPVENPECVLPEDFAALIQNRCAANAVNTTAA